MPRDGQYLWNYFRCPHCHSYLVVVRAVEGNFPVNLPCETSQCRGAMISGEERPVSNWPVTILKTATAEWYRPTVELHLMKKQTPRLWHAVMYQNRLVLRKLDESIEWTPENDAQHGLRDIGQLVEVVSEEGDFVVRRLVPEKDQ